MCIRGMYKRCTQIAERDTGKKERQTKKNIRTDLTIRRGESASADSHTEGTEKKC